MRKILIVSTVGLGYDGITNVILAYLQAMDCTKMEIYVAGTIKIDPSIIGKIEKYGCKIVKFPNRKTETIKYLFDLIRFIRSKKIEIIHAHGNSGTLAIEMMAGFLGGCKRRIAHSHNTKCDQIKADKILRPLFNILYTDAFACGQEAGKWLFGNREFTVLNNGRDIARFSFDSKIRSKMRSKFGIEDELVVGHVGGFNAQKNQKFVLSVFREILRIEANAKCFFVGSGPLEKEIKKMASDLKTSIFFTGTIDDVPAYLNMFDGMVLPSIFEGLPLVVMEWQINGLPCVISDVITKECAVTENITYKSLNKSPEEWAVEIISLARENISKREYSSYIGQRKAHEKGYDILENAKILEKIYLA